MKKENFVPMSKKQVLAIKPKMFTTFTKAFTEGDVIELLGFGETSFIDKNKKLISYIGIAYVKEGTDEINYTSVNNITGTFLSFDTDANKYKSILLSSSVCNNDINILADTLEAYNIVVQFKGYSTQDLASFDGKDYKGLIKKDVPVFALVKKVKKSSPMIEDAVIIEESKTEEPKTEE